MKFRLTFAIILMTLLFVSCEKDKKDEETKPNNFAYVVNFGGFGNSDGTISTYDIEKNEIKNNTYEAANGVQLGANPQSIAAYDSKVYIVSNSGDKLDILDAKDLKATSNPIKDGLINPRYFVAKGSYGYVSCWGEVADWAKMENSYIAKINLETNAIEKITLPGGPEGLMIIDNKMYIGSNTKNEIAVLNLNDDKLSYIHTPAIPKHFVNAKDGKLYTSLIGTYSVPFPQDSVGVGVIDLSSSKFDNLVNIPGINGCISKSGDNKTIYTYTTEADWVTTNFKSIDISNSSYNVTNLISGKSFTGFEINPDNGDIYLLVSPDATSNGSMMIYDNKGGIKDSLQTGIYPQDVLFLNI